MFPTSIAGSLPKPAWLAETHKLWPQWKVQGDELRQLRKLQREQDPKSPFVFTSERGSPF